jgi:tetratricopeptide (TPR) repeat protein
VLNNLGDALGVTGDPEGIACLESSLAIRREIGDRMGEAQAANNVADTYQQLGRTNEALDLYQRALELNHEIGYRYGEGVSLVNVGWTLLDLDRPGRPSVTCNGPATSSPPSTTSTAPATPCTSWAAATSRYAGTRRRWAACKRRCPATGPAATGAGRRPP